MTLPIIALSFLVLLSGCDNEHSSDSDKAGLYATLYFDKPVNQLYMEPGRAAFTLYPDNVIESLRGLGVQVEGLDFLLDKKEPSIIRVAIKDESFGPDQQQALKLALQDVLQAKRMPAFNGHVVMDPDSPGYKFSQSQLYERSDTGVYIYPQSEMTVSLKYNTAGLFDLIRSHGKSEVYCFVSSKINHDLPFLSAAWGRGDEFENMESFDMGAILWNYQRVILKMTFESKDFRRLLSEEEVGVVMTANRLSGSINEISVGIGSLGVHGHNYYKYEQFGRLSPEVYVNLEAKCESMAVKLGRPFTFHFGDGIDRLKAVVYTEQPGI
jgi:hypothetical protein